MRTTITMLAAMLLLTAQPLLAGTRSHGHRSHRGQVGYSGHVGHHGHGGYYRHHGYGHHGYGYRGYGYRGYGHHSYHGYPEYSHYPRYYGSEGVVQQGGASSAKLGAVDLNVRPKNTQVYLNGHYIGVTGAFDGFPRQLWLERGTHELTLLRPGFEPLIHEFTIRPGVNLNVRHRMRPGSSEPPTVRTRGQRRASEVP